MHEIIFADFIQHIGFKNAIRLLLYKSNSHIQLRGNGTAELRIPQRPTEQFIERCGDFESAEIICNAYPNQKLYIGKPKDYVTSVAVYALADISPQTDHHG